jgi:8-oxo-dGTP pyrophosphatase MutT (NUDIX family)
LPDIALCTAVYCLAIIRETGEVVLTRNKRGWEMLGGHINPGETVEEALIREAVEEGGFYPSDYMLYGYNRVTAKEPVVNDHHGGTYPQTTFIPHFLAETESPLTVPTGDKEEIFESRAFGVDELPRLQLTQESLILTGLKVYYSSMGMR